MLMLFTRTLAVAVFLSVLQSSPAAADYAAGLKAYDGGDFTEALAVWLPLAKEGDAKAQHGVALLYETGRGVPAKDDVEAAKWYAAAALQGIAESQANLALMFAEGRGVDGSGRVVAGLAWPAGDLAHRHLTTRGIMESA